MSCNVFRLSETKNEPQPKWRNSVTWVSSLDEPLKFYQSRAPIIASPFRIALY